MSATRYSKLQFEIEEDQIFEREEDYCDEDDGTWPPDRGDHEEDTPKANEDQSPISDPDPTINGATCATGKDPNLVVTRDYHRLAQTVGGNHSCLVLITNRSTTVEISNPVVYTRVGYTRIPPDSIIPPQSNTYCAFRKPSLVTKGTCGIISYEYGRRNGHSKRFAVMWKIPYRIINHEENEVALKWMDIDLDDPIDSNMHTGRELYEEMIGCSELVKGGHIMRSVAKNGKILQIVNEEDSARLMATFSGSCKAIVKVDFSIL